MCGGDLEFHHTEKEKVKIGSRTKELQKSIYHCTKCHGFFNCILFPSYEEYVIRGQIWVTPSEYHRIRKIWKC